MCGDECCSTGNPKFGFNLIELKEYMDANWNTNFNMVEEFHNAFEVKNADQPAFPDASTRELRIRLIKEEFEELLEAEKNDDLVEVADALTDMLYVIYGMGLQYGLDLDSCFEEVHSSNMSKLGEDGKPIRREDGKVLKGPNFRKPDLRSVLGL